ncbi:hypothetical protein E2C01_001106 [Portunus trituberculatus]|uniref:Uncharacterized protein n=1 Tax=Portunus trituberculatus TaxID=210409 RepID=A0A5B7CG34_PORTR|nr:hypothetical protein [Portunus trituberculatus]
MDKLHREELTELIVAETRQAEEKVEELYRRLISTATAKDAAYQLIIFFYQCMKCYTANSAEVSCKHYHSFGSLVWVLLHVKVKIGRKEACLFILAYLKASPLFSSLREP